MGKVTIRKRKVRSGTSLYLEYYFQGKQVRLSMGLFLSGDKSSDKEKLRLAEIKKNQVEIELFSGSHGLMTGHKSRTYLVDFAKQLIAKEAKPKSNLTRALPYLMEYFGNLRLDALTQEGCIGFQESLGKKLSRATVETYFNGFTKLLNYAVETKYLLKNPAIGMSRVHAKQDLKGWLTVEEVLKLAKTPIMGESGVGGRIKRAFLFACYTGLRLSDIRSLTWGEIREKTIIKIQGKTGNYVKVPLNNMAWELIKPSGEPSPGELVFGITGKTDPNQYVGPWAVTAGISQKVNFHLSRHTAGTLLLESGTDPFTVQQILGHKKIEMTMKYAKVTDRGKTQAVNDLETWILNQGAGNV